MPDEESEHHQHHDHHHHPEHHAPGEKQYHGGGGRLYEEGEGPRLPRWREIPRMLPFYTYPKSWKFKSGWLNPGRLALLVSGGSLALVVLCLALAKLLAG
jgi:hypothetical protein